jgi:hypothetical protein
MINRQEFFHAWRIDIEGQACGLEKGERDMEGL